MSANIKKIVRQLFNKGIAVNPKNIQLESLFHVGGTVDETEAIEYLQKFISIGFCQPKFYKLSVWNEAKELMLALTQYGIVHPYDYGRGKGKFTSEYSTKQIIDLLINKK